MREFIKLFFAPESHYTRTQNKHKKYLDASLLQDKMHRVFIEANQDLQYASKYSFYHQIFNYEFIFDFGYPCSNICNLCEKRSGYEKCFIAGNKKLQKKSKQEIELHYRKVDVFTLKIQKSTENAKTCTILQLLLWIFKKVCMPLPLTGITQEYYKRQVWIHNF